MQRRVTILVATIRIHIHDIQTIGSIGMYSRCSCTTQIIRNLSLISHCIDSHGTRCAGEVAAARDNGVCGVGVAYDSKIAGNSFVTLFSHIHILDSCVNQTIRVFVFLQVFECWTNHI